MKIYLVVLSLIVLLLVGVIGFGAVKIVDLQTQINVINTNSSADNDAINQNTTNIYSWTTDQISILQKEIVKLQKRKPVQINLPPGLFETPQDKPSSFDPMDNTKNEKPSTLENTR